MGLLWRHDSDVVHIADDTSDGTMTLCGLEAGLGGGWASSGEDDDRGDPSNLCEECLAEREARTTRWDDSGPLWN
jgi:hypothetical protein